MILVLLAALVIAYAAPQPWPYPSHPPGVHVFADTEVLTAYDLGNHNGGLTVRHADGTTAHFFIALPGTALKQANDGMEEMRKGIDGLGKSLEQFLSPNGASSAAGAVAGASLRSSI